MFGAAAGATPIAVVDTGPGPSNPDTGSDWSLDQLQWLAGEFTVGSAVTVTSVEGWMHGIKAGKVMFGLSSPGRFGPGEPLFSKSANLAVTDPLWQGVYGLNWVLAPGTYWVIYGVGFDSSFRGGMPSPSAHPLAHEAFAEDGAHDPGFWTRSEQNLGVRILGNTNLATTPEPAPILLLGVGLIGLGGALKRRLTARLR